MLPSPRDCTLCAHLLPHVSPGDHRCAGAHRLGLVAESAAYPTPEWMRHPGGLCGPMGRMMHPAITMEIAPRVSAEHA